MLRRVGRRGLWGTEMPKLEFTHTREFVKAEILQENAKTLWVRLPDGNVIKRKKKRDLRVQK
jgi:hypothetical protein